MHLLLDCRALHALCLADAAVAHLPPQVGIDFAMLLEPVQEGGASRTSSPYHDYGRRCPTPSLFRLLLLRSMDGKINPLLVY